MSATTFRIVEKAAGAHRRRPGRPLVFALGALLLVGSAVAWLPLAFIASSALILTVTGDPPSAGDLDSDGVLFLALSAAVAIVCWIVGVRLVRGRRRLVLFLRRFGFTAATDALTYAVGSGIGKRWRLVTLDDHEVAPLGVARRSRWTVRTVRVVAVGLLAVAVWTAISWLRGDPATEIADEIYQSSLEQAEEEGKGQFEAVFGAIFAAAFVGALLFVFSLVVVLIPVAVAGTSAVFLSVANRSVRRAERSKALVIRRPRAVARSVRKIARKSMKVFAPRMIVVRVVTPLWQDVVRRLAAMSDAVIVDVSEPSDNVVWEVRHLLAERSRWIPVGRFDRLQQVQVDTSHASQELRSVLAGRDVLAYTADDLARFASALKLTLDARPAPSA